MSQVVERFAPSPNGRLHLGHAFSALTAFDSARAAGGRFLLRIEDIDLGRAREAHVQGIFEDLAWLGIGWEHPVLRQSTRFAAYAVALGRIKARGLIYPCYCTRREITAALDAPQEGGPDGPAYPGICRDLSPAELAAREREGRAAALRLDMRKALDALGGRDAIAALSFHELGEGPDGETGRVALDADMLVDRAGDVVLARKDAPTSYHLSVVVDDAHQGVSHVTRGRDLFNATPIHRMLQALLGLPTPVYRHHRLIRDDAGKRLAKRDSAPALAELRAAGASPDDVRRMIGLDPV